MTQATGGIVTQIVENDILYKVHTFLTSDVFVVTQSGNVEYLVVAGGGGGADTGGGGAGGYRSSVVGESSGGGAAAENVLAVTSGTSYNVTIGAGGAGQTNNSSTPGTNGGNSVFGSITALGGGGGGAGFANSSASNGAVGGSGGGGSTRAATNIQRLGGAGTTGQGYAGGNSETNNWTGGGGGGAGGVGGNASGNNSPDSANTAGNGGIGVQSLISGSATYYAGGAGGGGGNISAGLGGLGGGGNGEAFNQRAPTSGTVNTGGGGGGGWENATQGAGGSGIVIIRYIPDLTAIVNITDLNINKFTSDTSSTQYRPVVPSSGTAPYSYQLTGTLPGGLSFNTSTGAISGIPTEVVRNRTYTVSITDSASTPATVSGNFNLTTNLSYLNSVDLVVNKTLTFTTAYGISAADRRASSVNVTNLSISVEDLQTGTKLLSAGNPLIKITAKDGASSWDELEDSRKYITSLPHRFNGTLDVNNNLKAVYQTITAEVSDYYLDNQEFTTAGTYTWTVPAGVTSISVVGIGGGGGGSQKVEGGTGGGGGQLNYINNHPVTPGDTYTIVVGGGGATGGAYALSGGDTYMYKTTGNTAPILVAAGGRGGDSMYWTDTESSISIYSDNSGIIYTFVAVSPVGETITYSIASGALPTGVLLDSSTGVLSGDPDDVLDDTNYAVVVAAATASQTITKNFNLIVIPQDLGLVETNPAPSIAALRAVGITTDGVYWFSTSKQATPFQAYVRFNYIDGGDWALLLKVHNQNDMPSGSAYWTNTTLNNATDFNLTSGNWSKYATWNGIPFNRLMMVMTQGGVEKVPPIMIFNTSRTFAEAIALAGGSAAANGYNNVVKANSTDPAIGVNATYLNMTMKSGTAFTDPAGVEDFVQAYGIGMWGNNASNSTTAEGFASTGRAGAWIGCPLDDQGHTFNNDTNVGSDSGFGFGFAAGNPAKTGSAGYAEWTNASSTNTLPGYVWVR